MSEFIPAQLDLLLYFFHSLNTKLIFYKKTYFCEQADIIKESCGFRNRAWGQTCARQPSASNFFLADVYSIEGQWINSYKGPSESPPGADTPRADPPEQRPPLQCMLGYTVNKRAVCILLECNLVHAVFGKKNSK